MSRTENCLANKKIRVLLANAVAISRTDAQVQGRSENSWQRGKSPSSLRASTVVDERWMVRTLYPRPNRFGHLLPPSRRVKTASFAFLSTARDDTVITAWQTTPFSRLQSPLKSVMRQNSSVGHFFSETVRYLEKASRLTISSHHLFVCVIFFFFLRRCYRLS